MTTKHKLSSIFLPILVLTLLSHGCRQEDTPVETLPATSMPSYEVSAAPIVTAHIPSEPGQFTVRYVPESTLNPITCLNRDNIVLSSLLYESLFVLDSSLNIKPILCESWSTDDNITYIFTILPDIAISDGSLLSADDIVYTISQAMQKGRFIHRLSVIKEIEATDELTVTITLKSANAHFIRLLDIPIIKNGSMDDLVPPGTGPYVFAGSSMARLVRFVRYRFYDDLPIPTIHLLECNDNEIAELFDSGVLSVLLDDPSDTFEIILNRQNETRLYETTTLQYIGFNTRAAVLREPDVRRAIGSSIDRAYITGSIIPGQPLAAPLALSSAYRLYDKQWEQMVVDPLREMSALLRRAGLEDFDNDSFLEYPDGSGGFHKISLDLIVNNENKYKTQTAHIIADTLRLYGFEIVVRELPWENFLDALNTGNFDLYYGEISLGADFDLSPLLLPNSQLNYGSVGSNMYIPWINDFLSALSDEEEKKAAEYLCDQINIYAPFVPILYKRYAVFTPIGAVIGASPSQSGVFCSFADWSIDTLMLP